MPPLLMQERLLFRLIWIGFVLLTWTIITGAVVSMRLSSNCCPSIIKPCSPCCRGLPSAFCCWAATGAAGAAALPCAGRWWALPSYCWPIAAAVSCSTSFCTEANVGKTSFLGRIHYRRLADRPHRGAPERQKPGQRPSAASRRPDAAHRLCSITRPWSGANIAVSICPAPKPFSAMAASGAAEEHAKLGVRP